MLKAKKQGVLAILLTLESNKILQEVKTQWQKVRT